MVIHDPMDYPPMFHNPVSTKSKKIYGFYVGSPMFLNWALFVAFNVTSSNYI